MANERLTRRQALARLGLAPATLYVAPAVLALSSAAHASSGSSGSSDPTVPTPPTQPTRPSNPSSAASSRPSEVDDASADHCKASAGDQGRATVISRRDSERARQSVAAGYAKPLNQIWRGILENYKGRIISVKFTGFRYRPTYRLRAVSPSGRLETVIVSARTGDIIRIVGC